MKVKEFKEYMERLIREYGENKKVKDLIVVK